MFETKGGQEPYVVSVGGTTTAEILRVLRIIFMGGAYVHERVSELVVSGGTSNRFLQCFRKRLAETASIRDVMEYLRDSRNNKMTYEAGLRWLLTNPLAHLRGLRPYLDQVVVIPNDALELDGEVLALMFSAGGEGPFVSMPGLLSSDEPWPMEWEFLIAHELR